MRSKPVNLHINRVQHRHVTVLFVTKSCNFIYCDSAVGFKFDDSLVPEFL